MSAMVLRPLLTSGMVDSVVCTVASLFSVPVVAVEACLQGGFPQMPFVSLRQSTCRRRSSWPPAPCAGCSQPAGWAAAAPECARVSSWWWLHLDISNIWRRLLRQTLEAPDGTGRLTMLHTPPPPARGCSTPRPWGGPGNKQGVFRTSRN